MRSAYLHPAPAERRSVLRRAASFALAVAAHFLVILLIWMLAPVQSPPEDEPEPSTFQLLPEAEVASTPAPKGRVAPVRRAGGGGTPAKQVAPAPSTPPPPVAPTGPITLPGVMPLDFAMGAATRGDSGDASGEASGADSGSAYGPGEGPGGERLYNAEWQREPSSSELGGYLPANAPRSGWALIACKTIEDYRVENCRILGESPVGSGLARAMRQAAWQFRVLPPRLGGRKLVGAWVRIRISFNEGEAGVR